MPVRRRRSSRKCGCAGVFARKRISRSYRRRTRRRSNSKSAYLRRRTRRRSKSKSKRRSRRSSRKIVRKGYVRRNPNGTVTYVRPALIKDRGMPGKGPQLLPRLTPGGLGKYGYAIKGVSQAKRRKALNKGVKAEGYAKIIRRLNVISILNKNTNPSVAKKAREDMAYLKKKHNM